MNFNELQRRGLSLVMAVAMAGTQLPVNAEAEVTRTPVDFTPTDISSPKAAQYKAEEAINPYDDEDVVRVTIVLEEAPTIELFSAEGIGTNASAKAYRQKLETAQAAVADTISAEALGGEALDVVWNLTLVSNSMSANVKYGQIKDIAAVKGVKNVYIETQYEVPVTSKVSDPDTATSGFMINAGTAYANGYTGAGSRIAIIDTGLDMDHQSFDPDGFQYSLAEEAGQLGLSAEEYVESLDLLDEEEIGSVLDQLHLWTEESAADLYKNPKVPFGYNYVDERSDYIDHNDPADEQGEHGSHVAGIAAANRYVKDDRGIYRNAMDTVLAQGVAPDAQLLVMKVFGIGGGAYDSDYMAGIEDAIILGADSVNLSLGSPCGFARELGNEFQSTLDYLAETDIVATMSAGNNDAYAAVDSDIGYLYGEDVSLYTGGSPASYTNALSVASADNTGITGNYLTTSYDEAIFYTETSYSNEPLATLAGEQEFILIEKPGTEEDFAALGDLLKGKIAVCRRGGISFYQKGENAVANGAIGTIIYNNQPGTINMDLSSYSITAPCVSITEKDGFTLMAAAEEKELEDGTKYFEGIINIGSDIMSLPGDPDAPVTMSSFSSWGIPSDLSLHPEITAPGGNIYSVNGAVEGGKSYEVMSGTSMSSPQMAGMAALVAQYIKANNLTEKTGLSIRQLSQSLLMGTAKPIIEEDSGNLYSVMKQGSGLADVGAAVTAKSYILMDESATESAADGKVKAELGHDPEKNGVYTVKYTVNNMSDEEMKYTLDADVFTQDMFLYTSGLYLDTWTAPIDADVTYKVNGEEFVPTAKQEADVDQNGYTDQGDAQAILDVLAGNADQADYDWEAADVDGSGDVTTYDAHLILTFVEEAGFTVEPNGTVDIEAEIALTDEQKEFFDEYYINGAYIEAFLYVRPTTNYEGVITDAEYSIPVIGFYGNWSDAPAYDHGSFKDFADHNTYDEETDTYTYDVERLPYSYQPFVEQLSGIFRSNAVAAVDENGDGSYLIGNPYVIGAAHPEEDYVSSDRYLMYFTRNIRGASVYSSYIKNADGEIVWSNPAPWLNQRQTFYHPNYGTWLEFTDEGGYYFGGIYQEVDQPLADLGFADGDTLTYGTVVIPEIYTKDLQAEDITSDWVKEEINSGELGAGAYLESSLVVDETYPEMTAEFIETEGEDENGEPVESSVLELKAKDNNWIAGAGMIDYSDWYMMSELMQMLYEMFGYGPSDFAYELGSWAPEELGEKGEEVTVDFDLEEMFYWMDQGMLDPQYVLVYAGDFAANEVGGFLAGDDEGEEITPEQHAAADAKALEKYPLPEEVLNGSVTPEEYLKNHPNAVRMGSLNVTVDGEKDVAVDKDAGKVCIDVNAEDSTNGLSTVEYDAEVLTLDAVKGATDFHAYNDAETGKVVVDFATAEALNGKVATLVFSYDQYSGVDKTTVKVTTLEDGEEKPEETEEVEIELEQADVTVTAQAGPNGSIAPTEAQTVKAGTELTFTVTPDAGYLVEAVLAGGEEVEANEDGTYTVVPHGDILVYATFTIDPDYVEPTPEPTEEPEPVVEDVEVRFIVEGNGKAIASQTGLVEPGTEIEVTWENTYGNVLKYVNVNGNTYDEGDGKFTVTADTDTTITVSFRILDTEFYEEYWWENGEIQGTISDPNGVADTQFGGVVRGREIFDPATNAWYWLDAVQGGKPAKDKEVWMPYVYQGEPAGSTDGKWVRYDEYGHMIKGWYANDNGTYYYDLITGAMAKGTVTIQGREYTFDLLTGVLQ